MRFVVLTLEMLKAHVSIFLRRRQAFVPQQFLDTAQVCSPFEKMGCEAVPQRVRRDAAGHLQTQSQPRDQTLDIPGTESKPLPADEYRELSVCIRFSFLTPLLFFKIGLKRAGCEAAEWNNAFLAAFAQYPDGLLVHINFIFIQSDKLAHAQTTRIKQFQNRPVSMSREAGSLGHLNHGCGFAFSQIRRQLLWQMRRSNQLRGVCLKVALAQQKLEKRSQ